MPKSSAQRLADNRYKAKILKRVEIIFKEEDKKLLEWLEKEAIASNTTLNKAIKQICQDIFQK